MEIYELRRDPYWKPMPGLVMVDGKEWPAEINGRPAWPIWSVSVSHLEEGAPSEDAPEWEKDAPEGWHRCSRSAKSGAFQLVRTVTAQDLLEKAEGLWEWLLEEKQEDGTAHPARKSPRAVFRFYGFDTWWGTWFSHETFRAGLPEDEVLRSFREYVDRVNGYNREHGDRSMARATEFGGIIYDGPICLMGAEDEWRWTGQRDADGDRTPAPCQCDHCVAQGVYRIGH